MTKVYKISIDFPEWARINFDEWCAPESVTVTLPRESGVHEVVDALCKLLAFATFEREMILQVASEMYYEEFGQESG